VKSGKVLDKQVEDFVRRNYLLAKRTRLSLEKDLNGVKEVDFELALLRKDYEFVLLEMNSRINSLKNNYFVLMFVFSVLFSISLAVSLVVGGFIS